MSAAEIDAYLDSLDEHSSGALRFPIDTPLPASLVNALVAVRLRQAFPAGSPPSADLA